MTGGPVGDQLAMPLRLERAGRGENHAMVKITALILVALATRREVSMKYIFALGSALLLVGCVPQAETAPAEPMVGGRVDCQRLADNPAIQVEFEQAKATCVSRAAGGSGATANQIGTSAISGCMGEMGYLFKTKSEHNARCDAIKEQKQRAASVAPAAPPPSRH